jgi:multimeric flavodoxin WrbA
MKVALFCGSANRNGNTSTAMKEIMRGINYKGIETELFYLTDYLIKPCIGCRVCEKTHNCVIKDDDTPILHKAIRECSGIILGSPTYYGDITGQFKQFVDRCYPFIEVKKDVENKTISFGSILKNKKPGIMVAVSGAMSEQVLKSHLEVAKYCFNDINAFLCDSLLIPYTTWTDVKDNKEVLDKAYNMGIGFAEKLMEK